MVGSSFCSAINCHNSKKKNQDKSFFSFPLNSDLSKRWVINTHREDLLYRNSQYLRSNCCLCSDHFEPQCFLNFLKNRLKPDAVPTLFNVPNPPKELAPKRRKLTRTENIFKGKTELSDQGKTLVTASQRPTNGVNEKSVVSSSELSIPVSKIKQETEEVILPSNDEHLIYTLNQRPQIPVITNVRSGDIDDDYDSDKQYQDSNIKKKQEVPMAEKSLPERKRNFPDSNENSFIEEYYKAKLEVLNKEHNAKLNAIKAEYELKIKFLKEEYEYKLAYLKSKKEYKVLKKLKLQNS